MRATRRTPGPATASGAWGRREIGAAGSIAYPARHAVARRAKAGRWADDAVARVVELVREDSLQATGRYTDVKNAIAAEPDVVDRGGHWPALVRFVLSVAAGVSRPFVVETRLLPA